MAAKIPLFCSQKGQTIDTDMCIARQNKKMCKGCSKGRAILESREIKRTRTKK